MIALAIVEGTLGIGWLLFDFLSQLAQRRGEPVAFRQNHRTLDKILQLADIPRPSPVQHGIDRVIGNDIDTLMQPGCAFFDKVPNQRGNVFAPFA